MSNPRCSVANYPYERLRKLGVSEACAREISGRMLVSSYRAEQTIFKKGCHIPSWSFIINGVVAETVPFDDGKSSPIGLYGQKSWFGEQSILNKQPSSAHYLSLTDVDLISIDAPTVHHLLATEHQFALSLIKLMAWRVQKNHEMLILMKLGNPCLRVVAGICQFAETLANSGGRPSVNTFAHALEIPVPQGYIAALCGVSRGTLSVNIQQLAQRGCLSIAYGKLELLKPEVWYEFANMQRSRSVDCLDPTIEDLTNEFKQIEDRLTGMHVQQSFA